MSSKRWTVGITYLVKPPFTPELDAFNQNAEFAFFDTRDEQAFDIDTLKRLDAMLVWTPAITQHSISHMDRCRIVVRYGVGFDKIDREALKTAGIAFANNPEYGPEDVADTAMAMLLSLQRRIVEHDQLARDYTDSWQENHLIPTRHSRDCTVGVVGVGRIGTALVNRLRPFGYQILGFDPYLSNGMFRAFDIERVNSLDELFQRADAISFHCPLTAETCGMIDKARLALARDGLILVNTARGQLLENLDVIEAGLRSGKLSAVGLDVLPNEPPAAHPLIEAWRKKEAWVNGRLLITPHNAFYSDASMYECRYRAAETARLFLEDNHLRNGV